MPGENSISFKVYIIEGNDNVEVRRFEVDQGVVTNFDYIRERLQYVFPRLRGKTFKILWSDCEGDEVTISSDEEMMIALSEIKSDLCKLIVRLPYGEGEGEGSGAEKCFGLPVMVCPALGETGDAACDGCGQPIQGNRYKCLECLQYNQCVDCEKQGKHPDHVVVRLSQNYPTIASLIPRGIHILKQHLFRCGQFGSRYMGRGGFMCGDARPHRREDSRDKCGGSKHRRHHSRRHSLTKFKSKSKDVHHSLKDKYRHDKGHDKGEKKGPECPGADLPAGSYILSDVENLISAFFNMFPKPQEHTQAMDTDEYSSQEEAAAGHHMNDGPPEPVKVNKKTEDEGEKDNEANASTSKCPNPKIMDAVKVLTEMGFKEEGKWLISILERFDGDISKALDHLMNQK